MIHYIYQTALFYLNQIQKNEFGLYTNFSQLYLTSGIMSGGEGSAFSASSFALATANKNNVPADACCGEDKDGESKPDPVFDAIKSGLVTSTFN